MMTTELQVSVVIPVYNSAQFLPVAVQNIRAQNVTQLEIIVVDDGSPDSCADVAESLGVRYFRHEENRGPAAARNSGLALAKSEIIAFLDVDDLWPEGSLRVRLEHLQKNPQLEVVMGKVQYWRDMKAEEKISIAPQHELSEPFVAVNIGAAVYRKSIFDKIGIFDPNLRYGEDTDWFMRAREAAVAMIVLPQVTLHYRLHPGCMTFGKKGNELNWAQVLKKSLDRRRSQKASMELSDLIEDRTA